MEIAEDIVRILKHPDLQRIIENAQELVKKQFNFEMCVENYKNTIQEVLK
jgi:glycosyltransferase involved in cell wall biosynthesis